MTLKDKLSQLQTLWTSLQTKIKNRLEQDSKTITETNAKLNETNHKLELLSKENGENVKIMEQLEKEFEEVGKELE